MAAALHVLRSLSAALRCAAVLVLSSALGACASEDYLIRSWAFESDISVRGLNCLCLSRDGFLWLGAKDGLVRFDGVSFRRQTFPDSALLKGNNVTALWQDAGETLWIGCESGDIFSWNQRLERLRMEPQHWAPHPIRSIAGDRYGDVWIALASHEVVRIRDGWKLPAQPAALSEGTVQPLLLTSDGRLYQQSGSIVRLQGGTKEKPDWLEALFTATKILRLAPSHKTGGLWIFGDDLVRRWTGTSWAETRGRLPPATYITHMIETSSGDIIAGTNIKGIIILRTDGSIQTLSTGDRPIQERIVGMAEDRDGNIMVCSDSRLHRLRVNRIRSVPSEDNWGGSRPVAVSQASDGTIWLGTEGAGLYQIGPAGVRNLAGAAGLSKLYIWSLLAESNDRLLVGTWGAGLFLGQDGRFAPMPNWSGANGWTVSALLRDRSGIVWAATNTGLWRCVKEAWEPALDAEGKPIALVRYLVEDNQGRIWVATNGHGVGYWQDGNLRMFGPQDGMPARFVSSLHFGRDGSLWAGTMGLGLYQLRDGQWIHIDHTRGLPAEDIFHIADDGSGHLWFTSNIGVFAIEQGELDACTRNRLSQLHPLIIDRDDGLPSNYCSSGTQSAAFMGADGQYIVPTARGLAIIPTRSIKTRDSKVRVAITTASIDDVEAVIGTDRVIRAPAGTQRLAFDFTAPTFTSPERIHFRYQLAGLDSRWVDLGPRRSVLFNHLPPGAYTLKVAASNPDGVWSQAPTALNFSIEPYFWETRWFYVLALVLGIGTVVGTVWHVVHRRTRLQLEHFQQQQAIEFERRRIASDIHDELGASLTQIMLLSQPGGGSATAPANGPELMGKVHAVACGITKSMDELVWAINPSHDTIESFAAYGARITQEIAAASGLRARLHLAENFPDVRLNAGTRHHLLLVLKEALNNAVRHARASEVRLTLVTEGANLVLEVADNGCGFTAPAPGAATEPAPKTGGHGLPNLRSRAANLKGTLAVTSAPERGTVVRLTIPIPR